MQLKKPKVHFIQITVDDPIYKELKQKKGKKSWVQLLYEGAMKE